VEWFASLEDARQKLAKFREHYNQQRPHGALADRTPAAFAELHRQGKEKTSPSMGRATRVKSGAVDCQSQKSLVSIGTEMWGGSNRNLTANDEPMAGGSPSLSAARN
jgi:hypothetical protein